jgi:hypothetical protein
MKIRQVGAELFDAERHDEANKSLFAMLRRRLINVWNYTSTLFVYTFMTCSLTF